MRRRPLSLAVLVLLACLLAPVGQPASAQRARSFEVTARWAPHEVLTGEKAVLSGRVSPVRRSERVVIQRQLEDGWQTVDTKSLNKDGEYRWAWTPETVGSYTFRVRMPRVGDLRRGTSPERTLAVTLNPVVTFTIPANSAHVAWNSSDHPVVAEVGQTLHLINGDSEAHLLHSDPEGPFPHPDVGQPIPPGGSADYLVTQSFSSWLYCHAHNDTNEKFWITVTDPATS